VLQGKTKGYRHHPQLQRFQAHRAPCAAIAAYLSAVHSEALKRGYAFDRGKLGAGRRAEPIAVTRGQIAYEWEHLLRKLALRSPQHYRRWRSLRFPQCHPFMRRCAGNIEPWERGA
jgi:hypothetical protein